MVLTNSDIDEKYSIMTALLYASDCYKIIFSDQFHHTGQISHIAKRLESISKGVPIANALRLSVHHLINYSPPDSGSINWAG